MTSYTYVAKSGVTVTTCDEDRSAEEDFPTIFHYLRWSYGSWITKIIKDVKLGFSEKMGSIS